MAERSNLLQVRLSGFGGQGIVMMGYILGKGASLYEGRYATLSQSYGPESRGGASACDVLISPEEIDYPKVTEPQVLVAMSQDAYLTYGAKRPPECVLLVEEDLVELSAEDRRRRVLALPASRLAEEMGRKIVANMVMLGFVAAATSVVGAAALKAAIETTVPRGTEKLNLAAFELGYTRGQRLPGEPAAAAAPAYEGELDGLRR